ncbi:DUF3265 domain-containing protein [Vibrio vulnificus]|nr:DUF3265 domain-containing protein [Vibrio vulnificus]
MKSQKWLLLCSGQLVGKTVHKQKRPSKLQFNGQKKGYSSPLTATHNKAFKRDSCRVAFLLCGGFGGESGLRKAGLCGIHPLTRRYV